MGLGYRKPAASLLSFDYMHLNSAIGDCHSLAVPAFLARLVSEGRPRFSACDPARRCVQSNTGEHGQRRETHMSKEAKPPNAMSYDELKGEIERTEIYLAELKQHLLFSLEQKESKLRAELDDLAAKKEELTGARPTEPSGRPSGARRTKDEIRSDAERIYHVIQNAKQGATRADIRDALPAIKLPQDIIKALARFGLKVKGAGTRRSRRYTAT